MGKAVIASLAALALAAAAGKAGADQSGVPFWYSGQFASLAAAPTSPGWSLITAPYYYGGSASRTRTFQIGNTLAAGVKSEAALLLLQGGYAPEAKILGAQPYIALGWGWGHNRTSVNLTLSQPALSASRRDSVTGGTDLYPFASLSWNKGNSNWMTYLTGDIPVGAYDARRLSNLGIGHSAIDAGGGYTYLNETTGRELSAVIGFTKNFENGDTHYKNGANFHLDWAASQFLSANWQLGVVGYVYSQLTDDSGSGNRVGAFRSQVAAAGPEVGYLFNFHGRQAYFNVRGYWEFSAKNRLDGRAVFATLSLPLGAAPTH